MPWHPSPQEPECELRPGVCELTPTSISSVQIASWWEAFWANSTRRSYASRKTGSVYRRKRDEAEHNSGFSLWKKNLFCYPCILSSQSTKNDPAGHSAIFAMMAVLITIYREKPRKDCHERTTGSALVCWDRGSFSRLTVKSWRKAERLRGKSRVFCKAKQELGQQNSFCFCGQLASIFQNKQKALFDTT